MVGELAQDHGSAVDDVGVGELDDGPPPTDEKAPPATVPLVRVLAEVVREAVALDGDSVLRPGDVESEDVLVDLDHVLELGLWDVSALDQTEEAALEPASRRRLLLLTLGEGLPIAAVPFRPRRAISPWRLATRGRIDRSTRAA